MADDPSPLRFRTYASFPVLNVGLLLFGSLVQAYAGTGGLFAWLTIIPATLGLFAAAFLGLYGLVNDCLRLWASNATWQPSWKRYVATAVILGAAVAAVVLFYPFPMQEDTVELARPGPLSSFTVGVALALGPVNFTYLLVRWRRLRE